MLGDPRPLAPIDPVVEICRDRLRIGLVHMGFVDEFYADRFGSFKNDARHQPMLGNDQPVWKLAMYFQQVVTRSFALAVFQVGQKTLGNPGFLR